MRFLDTNVLIYAAQHTPGDEAKRRQAQALMREPDVALSVQVLQEFFSRTTHPAHPGRLSPDNAMAFLELLRDRPLQHMTREVFETAVAISRRYQISYWDGAILAAARILGCEAVYSEDMSSQQDYDGVRVINPFREASEV